MRPMDLASLRLPQLADAFSAALLWVALAFVCTAMRDQLGASLSVWLPAGVLVASLHIADRRYWPVMLAVLGVAMAAWARYYGFALLTAVGYSVSSLAAAWVCVALRWKILTPQNPFPRTLGQIAAMFGAALLGCAIGTAIAFPLFETQNLQEAGWWLLANVLGMLAGAPVVVSIRRLMEEGKPLPRVGSNREFALTFAAMLLFSTLVLRGEGVPLLPLIAGMIIMATVRYGQIGTAAAVLACAAGATLVSIGGQTPVHFIDAPPVIAQAVLQQWILLMMAVSLPISAMLVRREELEAKLRQRNTDLHRSVAIFDLAEDLAGVGRWRYDLRSGKQEWSERMLELNGLDRSLAPDPGDVRKLLPDGGEELFGMIARHPQEWEPYSFNYRIAPAEGQERTLRISILNEFYRDGERIALFAVAMDVTEQVAREQALEQAHGRAVKLATEAQLLANTDPLTGLPNRRCSLARLRTLVAEAKTRGRPLSVVMFDIDNFKGVNDSFGHQTGDDVLVHVAEIARLHVRKDDLVGRIGGEEFVWLLPGLASTEAHHLADRLRAAIADGSGLPGLPELTASVGLATLQSGDDVEAFLRKADQALYAAKSAGRNRVRLAA